MYDNDLDKESVREDSGANTESTKADGSGEAQTSQNGS